MRVRLFMQIKAVPCPTLRLPCDVQSSSSSWYPCKWEMAFQQGNFYSAELLRHLLFLKIFLMPKRQIWGWHALVPSSPSLGWPILVSYIFVREESRHDTWKKAVTIRKSIDYKWDKDQKQMVRNRSTHYRDSIYSYGMDISFKSHQ